MWTTLRRGKAAQLTCQLQKPKQANGKELGVQELLLLCSVCNTAQQFLHFIPFWAGSQLWWVWQLGCQLLHLLSITVALNNHWAVLLSDCVIRRDFNMCQQQSQQQSQAQKQLLSLRWAKKAQLHAAARDVKGRSKCID